MGREYTPLLCKDCSTEIFADANMVMLNDELWNKICDNTKDAYCDCCIEKRLKRPIELSDLKECTSDVFGFGMVPCNFWWMQEQKKNGRIF